MIIEFPLKLRTDNDRQTELALEILQVVFDEWAARDIDCTDWLDELAEMFSEIASQ